MSENSPPPTGYADAAMEQAHANYAVKRLTAAIAFYTCLPIPLTWSLDFKQVSRLVVLVGLIIGGILAGLQVILEGLGMPDLTQSVFVTLVWVAVTGGLHLDGAMDTADGLAVQDPQRRLQVMTDSATGAFGAMAAIALLLLKTATLTDLHSLTWVALLLVPGWGRWAQQVAIARYPYLKPTGKGAFHKAALPTLWDVVPGLIILLCLSLLPGLLLRHWRVAIALSLGGLGIGLSIPAWFNWQLGGHTGDTYGAVVEWTEAFLLVLLTVIVR